MSKAKVMRHAKAFAAFAACSTICAICCNYLDTHSWETATAFLVVVWAFASGCASFMLPAAIYAEQVY